MVSNGEILRGVHEIIKQIKAILHVAGSNVLLAKKALESFGCAPRRGFLCRLLALNAPPSLRLFAAWSFSGSESRVGSIAEVIGPANAMWRTLRYSGFDACVGPRA